VAVLNDRDDLVRQAVRESPFLVARAVRFGLSGMLALSKSGTDFVIHDDPRFWQVLNPYSEAEHIGDIYAEERKENKLKIMAQWASYISQANDFARIAYEAHERRLFTIQQHFVGKASQAYLQAADLKSACIMLRNSARAAQLWEDHTNALMLYETILPKFKKINNWTLVKKVLFEMAESYQSTGQIEKAQSCRREAFTIAEECWTLSKELGQDLQVGTATWFIDPPEEEREILEGKFLTSSENISNLKRLNESLVEIWGYVGASEWILQFYKDDQILRIGMRSESSAKWKRKPGNWQDLSFNFENGAINVRTEPGKVTVIPPFAQESYSRHLANFIDLLKRVKYHDKTTDTLREQISRLIDWQEEFLSRYQGKAEK